MCGGMSGRKTAGESRVIRGGNWNNNSNNLASSNRNNNSPTNENNNIGFRVAGSRPGRASGSAPDKPLLAARIAEGGCRPRPCRAQEPPEIPAGDLHGSLRRISHGSVAVSSLSGESRGGVTGASPSRIVSSC
ncbi:SUMF1/EgtB/PvdO family nonheme iron enzyme [Haloferula sp. A504]|uniref:SUMF1/EgtB/PvdO family nonheme iron enzyme n=1 Tax=Haloferula sp. A504 TaxID=3373601 RepID=UPI003797D904